MNPVLAFLTTICLVPLLGAQRTWTVDAANGPGTDFGDLPPALVAASDGDTIVIRRGTYRPGSTNKGLTLLGEPGSVLATQGSPNTTFRVAGLPRGRTFVMKGISNSGTPASGPVLQLTNNAGRIHLDRLNLATDVGFLTWSQTVVLDRCQCVTMTDCLVRGSPALSCASSRLAVTGCSFRGTSSTSFGHGPTGGLAGIVASQSVLSLSRSSAFGGDGGQNSFGLGLASPAIVLKDGEVRIAGDSSNVLEAGLPPGTTATVAVSADGAELTIDPSVTLRPKGGAPAIGGVPGVLAWKRIAALQASGSPPGGSIATDLYAESGHLAVLVAGAPGDPVSLAFGRLWLDLVLFMIVDIGFVGASQHRSVTVGVPNDPVVRGVPVAFQALSGPPFVSSLELSTPIVVVLH